MRGYVLVAVVVVAACGCAEQITESLRFSIDTATLADMRSLHTAEAQFMMRNKRYGTLAELGAAGFIDKVFASGKTHGYIITGVSVGETAYAFRFDPEGESTPGLRHFYIDQTGVARANSKGPAGPQDPPASM